MTQNIKPTILFKRPEFIEAPVEFQLPDGTQAKLVCKFKYRTRKEFGALWDEIQKRQIAATTSAKADRSGATPAAKGGKRASANVEAKETPVTEEGQFSFESLFARGDETNAENALLYLHAWPEGLPSLSKESLVQVFDEAPAAAPAFWNTYRTLCTTGILGN